MPLPIDPAILDPVDIAALQVLIDSAHELKPRSSTWIAERVNNRHPGSPTDAQHLRAVTFPRLRPLLEPTLERRSRGQKLKRSMVSAAKSILEWDRRK
jgi:hypothetical protein